MSCPRDIRMANANLAKAIQRQAKGILDATAFMAAARARYMSWLFRDSNCSRAPVPASVQYHNT
jgi:hypothetical protein